MFLLANRQREIRRKLGIANFSSGNPIAMFIWEKFVGPTLIKFNLQTFIHVLTLEFCFG